MQSQTHLIALYVLGTLLCEHPYTLSCITVKLPLVVVDLRADVVDVVTS